MAVVRVDFSKQFQHLRGEGHIPLRYPGVLRCMYKFVAFPLLESYIILVYLLCGIFKSNTYGIGIWKNMCGFILFKKQIKQCAKGRKQVVLEVEEKILLEKGLKKSPSW